MYGSNISPQSNHGCAYFPLLKRLPTLHVCAGTKRCRWRCGRPAWAQGWLTRPRGLITRGHANRSRAIRLAPTAPFEPCTRTASTCSPRRQPTGATAGVASHTPLAWPLHSCANPRRIGGQRRRARRSPWRAPWEARSPSQRSATSGPRHRAAASRPAVGVPPGPARPCDEST